MAQTHSDRTVIERDGYNPDRYIAGVFMGLAVLLLTVIALALLFA